MSSNDGIKIIYFPFSPGIPWSFNKKFLINKVPDFVWSRFISQRKNIIVSNGGLIESFFSLSIAEVLNFIYPEKQVYWSGEESYKYLLSINGLLKFNDFQINSQIASSYNTPIFFDRSKNLYFNCLNNYLEKKSFDLKKIQNNKDPILKQIFSNALIKWDPFYIPKIRKDISENFNKWCSINKFYKNNPYIVIIPEKTKFTQHKLSCLGWGVNRIKALSSILYSYGINTLIVCDDYLKYKNPNNFVAPLKLDILISAIKDCKAIMSEDIDYLLLSMMISDGTIISKNLKNKYSLHGNAEFLEINSNIIFSKNLKNLDILNIIKEKL